MKKKLSLFLAVILLLSTFFSINVSAKTTVTWKGVKVYATKTISVFKNTKTTTSSGTIFNGDCITINSYNSSSKRFGVSYPVTTGKNKGATATGYINASDVGYNLSTSPSKTWTVAYGFTVKGYALSSKFNKCLTFSEGTEVYQFGSKGNYMSAVAKAANGTYWLIYIKKSEVRKVPSISTSKTYRIASKLNTNYGLDVAGGSKESGANIQLYKWNRTTAQVFRFKKSTNRYCIISCNSDKMVGPSNNYKNVAQIINAYWYIAQDNDGYLMFVPNGHKDICMDVAGGKVANKTNIQLYKINNTDSQKFKLIEVVKASESSTSVSGISVANSNLTTVLGRSLGSSTK